MKKLAILAAVAVLVGLPGLALATTLSYTTSTPIPSTKTDWTGSLAFPKFNPSLGTLTQVDLYLSCDMDTVLTVTNTANSASTGSAKTELMLTVMDGGFLISDAPQIDMNSPFYPYSLAAGASITSGDLTKSATNTSHYKDSALLAEFVGTSNISLAATTYTMAWINYNGGNTEASQSTNASATGTVTYEYTAGPPVPIPPTALLLGSGLVGLLALRRRQKGPKS